MTESLIFFHRTSQIGYIFSFPRDIPEQHKPAKEPVNVLLRSKTSHRPDRSVGVNALRPGHGAGGGCVGTKRPAISTRTVLLCFTQEKEPKGSAVDTAGTGGASPGDVCPCPATTVFPAGSVASSHPAPRTLPREPRSAPAETRCHRAWEEKGHCQLRVSSHILPQLSGTPGSPRLLARSLSPAGR